ncbi:MAG: PleD family two-component system response regulator [Candidatus Hodarchaeota archaeon]
MKPLIILVEDDPNILKYLKMMLEFNDCQVITAENGKEGRKVLSELKDSPDLIISDIMMPEMNGYDFFEAVSNNPIYCQVPFIFLSALDSPEDVRFGKMLGVDDYLTKPINEEDFLAIVFGKIKRNKTINLINEKINEIFSSYEITEQLVPKKAGDLIVLIEVHWDDVIGPKKVNHFPKDTILESSLNSISDQLYDGVKAMYGHDAILSGEGLLIPLKNYNIMAYIFFDSYPHEDYRGGRKDYMFSILASSITYFQSLKFKQIFIELSTLYKKRKKWDIEKFWNKFSDILSKSSTLSS